MSMISDTNSNADSQNQFHFINGSIIKNINGEKESSKVSDTSKDFKELTNEINNFMIRSEENGNSKSNSGVGDHFAYEELGAASHSEEVSSLDIEFRISEMKRLNELKLRSKAKQIKLIANTSKVRNELIDKFMNMKDTTNNQNRINLENPQMLNGSIEFQNGINTGKKEMWSCIPSKKMLYSTYSSNIPSISSAENYFYYEHNQENLPQAYPGTKPELETESGECSNNPHKALNINSKNYVPNRKYQIQQTSMGDSSSSFSFHDKSLNQSCNSDFSHNQQSSTNVQSKEFNIILENVSLKNIY